MIAPENANPKSTTTIRDVVGYCWKRGNADVFLSFLNVAADKLDETIRSEWDLNLTTNDFDIGVRPSDLNLVSARSESPSISGRVRVFEEPGTETVLHLVSTKDDETEFRATVAPSEEIEKGEEFTFTFDSGDVHLFNRRRERGYNGNGQLRRAKRNHPCAINRCSKRTELCFDGRLTGRGFRKAKREQDNDDQ